MANPGLIKNFYTPSVVDQYRIVSFTGVKDREVEQASLPSGSVVGVSEHGSTNQGRVDVIMSGTGFVQYGGDIAAGDPLVADAQGQAVKFDPANHIEDEQVWIVGQAMEAGDAGTIGVVVIRPMLIVK